MQCRADTMIFLEETQGRIHMRLRALDMGDDLCILLDGGHKPHIGALTITTTQEHKNSSPSYTHTHVVPSHKEGAVSEQVTRYMHEALHRTIVCVCGIHIDQISAQEITLVFEMAHSLCQKLEKKLLQQ